MLIPASAGAHGPGEITTPAGAAPATWAAVTSSLRTTSTQAARAVQQVGEVPGERVVVVDEDHERAGRPASCCYH